MKTCGKDISSFACKMAPDVMENRIMHHGGEEKRKEGGRCEERGVTKGGRMIGLE